MQADHQKIRHQLAIVKGQMEGIAKMVEEDAYCMDISNQILSAIAMLKNVNRAVISAHLEHCLKHAKPGEELDQKIKEVEALLSRMD
ncbi:MAG: metal-sensing transcriptional repressor [Bacilli bacterium]|nr:metal-sensing transcriptional repressor [Bacilli bacterium]